MRFIRLLPRWVWVLLSFGIVLGAFFGIVIALTPSWPVMAFSVALSGDGTKLAIGSHQGQIVLYDTSSRKSQVSRCSLHGIVRHIALSYDAERIGISVQGLRSEITQVCCLRGLQLGRPVYQSPKYGLHVRFCDTRGNVVLIKRRNEGWFMVNLPPDQLARGRCLVPSLEIKDLATGETLRRLSCPVELTHCDLVGFMADSSVARVVAGFEGGSLLMWQQPNWQPQVVFRSKYHESVQPLGFVGTTDGVIAIIDDAEVVIVDTRTHAIAWRLDVDTSGPWSSAVSTDEQGKLLATINDCGRIVSLWKVSGDHCVRSDRIILSRLSGLRPWTGLKQWPGWKKFFQAWSTFLRASEPNSPQKTTNHTSHEIRCSDSTL